MSDTDTHRTVTTRTVRKVPAIILERPPLRGARVLFGLVAGIVFGFLTGFLFWLLLRTGPGGDEVPRVETGFQMPYWGTYLILGAVVGLVWTFLEGRAVTPRRDVVEVEVGSHRTRGRSSSSAIELRRR